MQTKSDIQKYDRVIVTDENNRPMTFENGQFCYNTDCDWQDKHFAIRTYSRSHANRLIFRSQAYRKKNGFSIDRYKTMPIVTP